MTGGACLPADFRGHFSAGQAWTATLPVMMLMREFGVEPSAEPVRETVALVQANCRWEHASPVRSSHVSTAALS